MHVTRPPVSRMSDVTTLADLKTFLRVDHDEEDDLITGLADAAIQWCEDYCNRKFATGSTAVFYLERFRPAALAYGPVTSLVDVRYFDTAGVKQVLDTSKYYHEAMNNGSVMLYFHDVPDLEDYNAHPVLVNANVGTTVTKQAKQAVNLLVGHWYENRRTVVTGTIATSIPFAVEALLSSQRILDMRQ